MAFINTHALANLLGIILAGSLAALMLPWPNPLSLLGIFLSVLIALPLLDRTRFWGLVTGATLGGFGSAWMMADLGYRILPRLQDASLLLAACITACVVGLLGSALLSRHGKRYTTEGIRRHTPTAFWQPLLYAGFFSASLLGAGALYSIPLASTHWLLSAVAAAACAVALNRRHPALLPLVCHAFICGMVVGFSCATLGLWALTLGALAYLLAARAETIAQALLVDDPFHYTSLILCAGIGLLLPGILSAPLLASLVIWLCVSIGAGLVIAALLWPAMMLLVGLALPPRLLREAA